MAAQSNPLSLSASSQDGWWKKEGGREEGRDAEAAAAAASANATSITQCDGVDMICWQELQYDTAAIAHRRCLQSPPRTYRPNAACQLPVYLRDWPVSFDEGGEKIMTELPVLTKWAMSANITSKSLLEHLRTPAYISVIITARPYTAHCSDGCLTWRKGRLTKMTWQLRYYIVQCRSH